MKKLLLTVSFVTLSGPALAHMGPGTHDHGPLSHGLAHAFADFGLLALFALLVVVFAVTWLKAGSGVKRSGRHDH